MNSMKRMIQRTSVFLLFCAVSVGVLWPLATSAEIATSDETRQVCQNWLTYRIEQSGNWARSFRPEIVDVQFITHNDTVLAHCYSIDPSGFIIVPLLKALSPIKAYSEEYSLNVDDEGGFAILLKEVLTNRFRLYAEMYGSLEVRQPQRGTQLFDHESTEEWELFSLVFKEFLISIRSKGARSVIEKGPLLTTAWEQDGPYNSECPAGDGGQCVVGCVATAAAQIMKYHNWPPAGNGTHTYTWDGDQSCGGNVGGGNLAATFSNAYDWENMPDICTTDNSQVEQDAVSELCYEVGIAFDMDYGFCGSGAVTADALTVFPTYFNYDGSIDKEDRDAHSQVTWFDIIKAEIDAMRPMQYRIVGHSIVCDGYREDTTMQQYHINYGWGGPFTCWYNLDNIYGSSGVLDEYMIRHIMPNVNVISGGTLLVDTVWEDDSVYFVTGDVIVPYGISLTILSGTIIKFDYVDFGSTGEYRYKRRLIVEGDLDIQGTSSNPVVFTSARDDSYGGDTNGDGMATAPSGGDWGYIKMSGTGTATIQNCLIRYGGAGRIYRSSSNPYYRFYETYSIWVDQVPGGVSISDCTIEHIFSDSDWPSRAIYWRGSDAYPITAEITNNTISDGYSGVYVQGGAAGTSATVTGNQISQMAGDGISFVSVVSPSLIQGNGITLCSSGITSNSCSPTISGNQITDNSGYPLRQVGTSFPLYSGNTISGNTFSGVGVSGSIEGEGTWVDIQGMPYVLYGDVTVASGATLHLPLDMVVKFDYVDFGSTGEYRYKRRLIVEGDLDIQGTSSNPVVFTSARDDSYGGDTNGDGMATAPSGGDWGYIKMSGTGTATIQNCLIRYGGAGRIYRSSSNPYYRFYETYSIWVDQVPGGVSISDCTIEHIFSDSDWPSRAIYWRGSDAYPITAEITNNTISDGYSGVYVQGGAAGTSATVTGNQISQMAGDGIYCTDANANIFSNTLENSGSHLHTGMGLLLNKCKAQIVGNKIDGYMTGAWSYSGTDSPPCTLGFYQNRILGSGDAGLSFGSTDVAAYTGPYVSMNNNDIYGNVNYALYLGQYQNPFSTTIDVENNWWGSTEASAIEGHIYHSIDDGNSPIADFIPFLYEPVDDELMMMAVVPNAIQAALLPDTSIINNIQITNQGIYPLEFDICEAASAPLVSKANSNSEIGPKIDIPWIAESPTNGVVGAGHAEIIDINISSLGLLDSVYLAYLVISSNDPVNDLVVIPVQMTVSHVYVHGPADGDTIQVGDNVIIDWSSHEPENVTSVNLFYSTDSGQSFANTIATDLPNVSPYEWSVSGDIADSCQILIEAEYSGGSIYHNFSDGYFMILDTTADQPFTDISGGVLIGGGADFGIAWGDFNNDTYDDIYISNLDGENILYEYIGGDSFTSSAMPPLNDALTGISSYWGDSNNDGLLDVYVLNEGDHNKLFMNMGGGVFNDVTGGILGNSGNARCGAWVDYDSDGHLDIYITNNGQDDILMHNNGIGGYDNEIPVGLPGASEGCAWGDYDNDGDQDLFLANTAGYETLFRNDGDDVFTWLDQGSYSGGIGDQGVACADYDNDGDLDIYIAKWSNESMLLRNDGDMQFTNMANDLPLTNLRRGQCPVWADYDNDGWIDLYVTNYGGDRNRLLHNRGDGTFIDVTNGPLESRYSSLGTAWCDYDHDGDLDLYVVNYDGDNRLLRNNLDNGYHWLHVNLTGTLSNSCAIGARIYLYYLGDQIQMREVNGGNGYFSQNSMTAEFGLGAATEVDSLKIVWPFRLPGGQYHTQIVTDVPIDTRMTIVENDDEFVSVDNDDDIPKQYCLNSCYPNPFNPMTNIGFDIPVPSVVSLRIYDISGKLVRELVSQASISAGRHVEVWDGLDSVGRQVSTGVYFYQLQAGQFKDTKRMTLIK